MHARIDFAPPPVPDDLKRLVSIFKLASPHDLAFDPETVLSLVERLVRAEAWIKEAQPLLKAAYDNDVIYFTNAARFLQGPSCYDR